MVVHRDNDAFGKAGKNCHGKNAINVAGNFTKSTRYRRNIVTGFNFCNGKKDQEFFCQSSLLMNFLMLLMRNQKQFMLIISENMILHFN